MKIKNILTGFGVIAMAMLTACGDDDVAESGIFGVPEDGAYFGTNLPAKVELDKNGSTFDVTVSRAQTSGTLTAAFTANDPEGVFTVPSSITFAEGAATATLTIGYDPSLMRADVNYPLSIKISQGASEYGSNDSYSFNAVIPGDWTAWTKLDQPGVYTYTGTIFSGEDGPCPVYTRTSLADPNIMQYCFGNIGMAGVSAADEFGLFYGVNLYVNRDLTTNVCSVPEVNTLVTYSDGSAVYISDTYAFTGIEAAKDLSTFNPETGLFSLNVSYYLADGRYFAYNVYEYFQLGGYADYSMAIERRGNYVEGGKETALFYVYKGADVEYYRYAFVPGDLTEEEVQTEVENLKNAEEAAELEESGFISVDFTDPGTYTVILLGYANKEVKTVYTEAFRIETVQASSDWESLGYVEYTDGYICSIYPNATPEPYYVEVEGHKTQEGYYRLVNPYGEAYPYISAMTYDPNTNSYLVVNAFDPDYVYVEESTSTTDIGYGAFTFSSVVTYYMDIYGYSPSTLKQAGIPAGKLENGAITFELQSLFIYEGADGPYDANCWISNYGQPGVTQSDWIREATEKIDFNTLVSASQAKSTVSKAYSRAAAASVAKNRVIKSDMKFDSKLGNASKNASVKPVKAISGKTLSGKSVKAISGKSVKMNIDPRTATISGSL